jgi:hypothetical protein
MEKNVFTARSHFALIKISDAYFPEEGGTKVEKNKDVLLYVTILCEKYTRFDTKNKADRSKNRQQCRQNQNPETSTLKIEAIQLYEMSASA